MNRQNFSSMRYKSLSIIICLMIVSITGGRYIEKNSVTGRIHHHQQVRVLPTIDDEALKDRITVEDTFVTHLPLIIINTGNEVPRADSVWDEEKGYRIPVTYDPYATGELFIIDQKDSLNSLTDEPTLTSHIKIRLRGNSSLEFDKKQYLIKLINEDGSKNKQDVLGMGKNWEWILNISFIDKSLLRNYLCLNIAGEILSSTPDVRFCEVIIRKGGENFYQGVYLMMEPVSQGTSRVDVAEYNPRYHTAGYILRRDRYDETGTMLNNYGMQHHLTEGYLDIKYPGSSKITKETVAYIENTINEFEQAIFSNDSNTYLLYNDQIDVQSFMDYFIINEFFANYDAGYNSTYVHSQSGNKLIMGPVWDFDHAIDNFDHTKLRLDTTAMHAAPWFRQLLRDEKFTTKLIERYHELRQSLLSDEYIQTYIDETIAFLGPAQERDWNRWRYFYEDGAYLKNTSDEYGGVIERNTKTYEEEIDTIKYTLSEHGNWLDKHIDSLYQFNEFDGDVKRTGLFHGLTTLLLGKNEDQWSNGIAALLFISIFIISIVLIQKE